jgi:hypothetical protein
MTAKLMPLRRLERPAETTTLIRGAASHDYHRGARNRDDLGRDAFCSGDVVGALGFLAFGAWAWSLPVSLSAVSLLPRLIAKQVS